MWQVLYEQCKDQNFEIVAVALDAGGASAVEPWIRCTDLTERSDAHRGRMGWSETLWRQASAPTYTCLIDEEHKVADLFGIKNVPEAVWIDEEGRIVRAAEPAGASSTRRPSTPGGPALAEDEIARLEANRGVYWDAVHEWVKTGSRSPFALSAEEITARLRRPSEADVRAAAHSRIGRHLFKQGDSDAARRQFEAAAHLCPDKWNYRRQSMVLEPGLVGALNIQPGYYEAVARLDGALYYDAIDMPGMTS